MFFLFHLPTTSYDDFFYQSYYGYTRQCSLVFGWNLQTIGKLLDFPKSGYDWIFTGGDDWSDLLPPYYIPTVSPFSLFGSLVISSTKRKSELHFLSPFIHPGCSRRCIEPKTIRSTTYIDSFTSEKVNVDS